jgi:hypothetical protein
MLIHRSSARYTITVCTQVLYYGILAVFLSGAALIWPEHSYAANITVTVNALTATPVTVQAGQTIVFSATMTASQNASNYPVEFSVPGKDTVFFLSFTAGKPVTETFSWTVPASTAPGSETLILGVYNPSWQVPALAYASTKFNVSAARPVNSQLPVISGVAQVGKLLTSSTGVWTNATSYAYQWAGNGAAITGATASTYTPGTTDVGHTLTVTVTATGLGGSVSAISAATVPVVAAASSAPQKPGPSADLFNKPYYSCVRNFYVASNGADTNKGTSSSAPWLTLQHANDTGLVAGDCVNVLAGTYSGVSISRGGNLASSTGYVTYRCTTLDACTINANAGVNGNAGFYFNTTAPMANFVIIDGFKIAGSSSASYGQGVEVWDGKSPETTNSGHHIWVLNNIIFGNSQSGVQMNDGEYFYVLHNTIYGNANSTCDAQGSGVSFAVLKAFSSYTPSGDDRTNPNSLIGSFVTGSTFFHNVIEWNNIYNNALTKCGNAANPYDTDGNNIIIDSNRSANGDIIDYENPTLIAFNLTYNSGGGGIRVFFSEDVTVANNSCYNAYLDPYDSGSDRACISTSNSSTNTFINNIAVAIPAAHSTCAYNAAPYAMWNNPINGSLETLDDPDEKPDVFTNNITYLGGSNCQSEVGMWNGDTYSSTANKKSTNPMWVDVGGASTGTQASPPVGANFALRPGSPAIGYGITATYLPPYSVDVGACASALATCP